VNAESVVAATLSRLAREGKFDQARAQDAFTELAVDTETADPAYL
jgi:pyruvate dehydrogenase E1 component